MKLKSMLMTVFTFVLVCTLGVFGKAQLKASANESVDITSNITITGWDVTGDARELTYTRLSLGDGVLPADIGYGIIDKASYKYIQEYITINGKTVKEINEQTDVSSYVFSTFPSTADAKYKIPVIIYFNNNKLEIKVHNDYIESLGTSIVIGVKAGLQIENGNTIYKVTSDVTQTVWEEIEIEEVDITSNITITGWDATGNARELTYTRLSLGEGVLPADIGYGIIDKASYKYIQEYITINGKTVKEINEQTDVSSYVFSTFPSTADAKYKIPVIVFVNGETLEIKVHNDYVDTLGTSVVIGVKAGLQIENGNAIYKVTSDVTQTVWEEIVIEEVDITSNITITGWDVTGNARELTYTRLSLGDGVLPADIGYGIIDKASYKYIQEYITINGKTVKEINEQIDVSSYVFSTFPSTADAKYKIPVIIYFNNNKLEIKVHNDYIESLGDIESVEIGVKAGLAIENDAIYKVTSDVTQTVWEKVVIEEVDIVENVSVSLWITQSEYQVTYLNVGENVIPTGIDYGATLGAFAYVQEYILINGRTIKEINADTTLGASDWEYTIFPTTADSRYKLPIILFAKTNSIEVKIHSNYLAILGETLEITIKTGFYVENGNRMYLTSKDVEYALYGATWADKNKKNKVTYYLNGDVYGEVEEVLHGTPLVLRENPEVPQGYFFSGWEYSPTNGIVTDMEIQGYIRPIEYTITYNLNGGVNAPQNPISYYITDGEVVLNPATKDGATFVGWYTSSDYTQKVEKLTPSNLGDVVLYAKFEENKKGCKSSIFDGSALALVLCLAVVAIRLKNKA